uniref:Uncharacterized protein n=1 Tax=Virgibacillus oceani TaxID=1479511 RepID=A0A917HFD4_9BACI|nr:hypothetical protein GCM10011398_21420 [Virgibacillus oceani]
MIIHVNFTVVYQYFDFEYIVYRKTFHAVTWIGHNRSNPIKRGKAHLETVIPQWPTQTQEGLLFYFYRT